jgi:orotate phosphoribosyltransferase
VRDVQTRDAVDVQVDLGDPAAVRYMLSLPGVLRTGHFDLLSGLHSDTFLAFSGIASDSEALRQVVSWMAPSIAPWGADVVFAPSTAGVALAGGLALELQLPLALTTLSPGGRALGVLGDIDLGLRRVLIVNDVLTTGKGLAALRRIVENGGGEVVGSAWFLTRSDGAPQPPLMRSQSVASARMPAWPAAECQMCADGMTAEVAIDLN